MKFVFIIIIILHPVLACPQSKTIDSLKEILQIQNGDTNKVNTLNIISEQISSSYGDYNAAVQYAAEALTLAEKINFEKGKRNACDCMGLAYKSHLDYGEALKLYFKSLRLSEVLHDKHGIAQCYNNIGYAFYKLDKDPDALKYLFTALRICREIGDKRGISFSLNIIGSTYYFQHNYSEAEKYFLASLKVGQETGDKQLIGTSYKYLGISYSAQGDAAYQAGDKMHAKEKYTAALDRCIAAFHISEKVVNKLFLCELHLITGMAYEGLGAIFLEERDYITSRKNFLPALQNYLAGLQIAEEIKDKNYISEACNNLGSIYIKTRNFNLAEKYLKRGLQVSREIQFKTNIRDSYSRLTELETTRKNYKKAYEYYKLFIFYRDSLINEENTKKSARAEMQYEFDKKQDSIRAVQDKKNALAASEIKNQKLIRNFSVGGAFAVISFGGYSFYRYRRRRKLQSQQEMLNERLRISRELHDDIGSTLGSISIYSEVAKNRSQKNESADEAIAKIGSASRELIEKMSDIVWSINPNNESFEQLQNRMQAFAAMILTPHNIQYNFFADQEIKKLKLTAEERKNIFLIFKEAVYNIVKYAECSNVEIRLSSQNNRLEMQIRDDGKGFETSPPPSLKERENSLGGNGIKNMQARARDINASLDIRSEIRKGTVIQFFLTV